MRMKFFRLLSATLREIFQESAYDRFCAREKVSRGKESYAQFLRESASAENKIIRCC